MKLVLKDFQDDAVAELRKRAAFARNEVAEDGSLQTLILAAPTGSGKTVIATRWMELLLRGDDAHPADPQATFLWLTDQPELNEQTRRKMESGSTVFRSDDLVTIDASFDRETLDAGKVHFLNIQKLGRNASLVKPGDRRSHTIWQTIRATAEQRPGSFWVVIDEAHKGMAESSNARREATTIVQKFIKGAAGEVDAVPLLLGISATPERFTSLLTGTPRSQRPVTVDPDRVRGSGLLKDAITLFHPEEAQPSDLTLLRDAAGTLKRYRDAWAAYAEREQAPAVEPILVVQVDDASATRITKTDIAACLAVIEEVLGPLGDAGVAHSFQESLPIVLDGERRLRYVAPADIQDDTELKAVLFKRSLTTGWDCPRAEVMMSFRKAVDQTLIAQLVGRMVRTPLARSVSGSEFLNSVSLYLPNYDAEALDEVIEYLTEPDPEIGFPTRVQRGENLVTLERNPDAAEAFAAAERLVTYRVERVSKQSDVRRLLRLGRALAWDKLDEDAGTQLAAELVAVLDAERARAEGTEAFAERLADAASIDVRAVTVAYGDTAKTSVRHAQLAAVAQNVEGAFADAGRQLGGGLHAAYLRHRAAQRGAPDVSAIKLELFALMQDEQVPQAVEARAGTLLSAALEQHKVAIRTLPDERRQLYRHIRRQAARPEAEDWELPEAIEGIKNGNASFDRHLYVTDAGGFTCRLNDWEREVLADALADDGVVGWLRNDPRKEWSFTVPYEDGKQFKPMYPDFLVFRRQGDGIVCDILEPHALSWADAPAKAKGLAAFARDHGDELGRIQLLAKIGGRFERLVLDDIETRDKVLAVATLDHLKLVFEGV